jgi:hypothetical protein
VALAAIVGLVGCGAPAQHQKLNGVWMNGLTFVRFDFDKGEYIGAGPFVQWQQDLKLVEEKDGVVYFTTDSKKFTATFKEDGSVILQKEGDYDPFPLTRVKEDGQVATGQLIEERLKTPLDPPAQAHQTPAPKPTTTPGEVGERVVADDVALTIVKTEMKDKLSEYEEAPEGSTYLVAEVVIENGSNEAISYNPTYFKIKDADGFEYNGSGGGSDTPLHSGELPQGEKVRGTVTFKIRQGAEGLVVNYDDYNAQPIRVVLN